MPEDLRVERPSCTVSIKQYAPGTAMSRHGHDFGGLSVVLSGSLIEDVGHTRVEAGPGDVVLKPRGTMHENRFGPRGALLLSLTFDAGAESVASGSERWRWSRSVPAVRLAARIVAALRDRPSAGTTRLVDGGTAELIAEVMHADTRARPLPSWLEDVRAQLDSPGAHPSSVAQLAAAHNVHPVYLARRFREAYGCSMSTYRRRVRLLSALPSITASRLSFTNVAADAGFADHSHLCRECQSELGSTPSRLRKVLSPQ